MDRSKIWEQRSWHWNYHDQFPENRATEQPGSDGHRTMNGTWHTAFVVCCPERPWTVTASAESHKASFFMQHQIIPTWIYFIMMLCDKTMWAFWAEIANMTWSESGWRAFHLQRKTPNTSKYPSFVNTDWRNPSQLPNEADCRHGVLVFVLD